MSMYLKQIEQLVALQRIDSEIIDLNKELETAPREVHALEGSHSQLDTQYKQLMEKIGYLKEQESRLSAEIEDDTLKIKKSKNKLMMVSNTKEYHAMMREMDNLEKLNRLREEERVTLSEELVRLNESKEELDSELGTINKQLEEKRSNLQARVAETQKRLDELDAQRKDAGSSVPPPVLSRYEFIRSRLVPPVIVKVEQGICNGCHIAIPPQSFNDLQKGQQILSCPNCQRLIYWCEHFSEDEQCATPKEKEAEEAAE